MNSSKLKSRYFGLMAVCAVVSLTGCVKKEEINFDEKYAQSDRERSAIKKQYHEAMPVGKYDGCDVNYHVVKDGFISHQFYIAKCDGAKDTTTTTSIDVETKQVGKLIQNVEKVTATITTDNAKNNVVEKSSAIQEMNKLDEKKRKLIGELALVENEKQSLIESTNQEMIKNMNQLRDVQLAKIEARKIQNEIDKRKASIASEPK